MILEAIASTAVMNSQAAGTILFTALYLQIISSASTHFDTDRAILQMILIADGPHLGKT